jgi:uncharacterized protein (TIGR00369 family)
MKPTALTELNRAIQSNQIDEVTRAMGREPGMRALEFQSGSGRWQWDPSDERARNPFGYIYGGYLAVFVDIILSSTIATVLGENELAMTAEFKLDFVRPAAFAPLRGVGRVRHKGGRVAFVEATLESENGELLVAASSTWTVVRSTGA